MPEQLVVPFTLKAGDGATVANAHCHVIAKPESFTKTIEYLTKNLTDATVVKTAAPTTVPANDADIVIVINK